MKKDAFYFPHFCNARHDRKLKRIRKELGIEGYGIYFMILEVLREQPDFKYPVQDLDLLADEFGTSDAKVRTVVSNYELFFIDENQLFFSIKLVEFLEPYTKMKLQRSLAGKASAAKRSQHPFNDRSTTVEQRKGKESKVKEIKEKESKVKESKLILPFDSKNFVEVWNVLKSEPKWRGKSANALQAALKKLSKNTEADAIEMMENAIAGGWQGIFDLDKKNKFDEKRNDLADFGKAVNAAAADIFGS